MKKMLCILLCSLLLLAVSCEAPDTTLKDGNDVDILVKTESGPATDIPEEVLPASLRVLWETELEMYADGANDAYYADGYAYIQERFALEAGGAAWVREVKVRLSDGSVMWRTKPITTTLGTENVVKGDGHIYIPYGATVYVFSDEDGRHEATVHVSFAEGKEWKAKHNYKYSAISGPYMFWGNTLNPNGIHDFEDTGLVRFDTRKIDYTKPAEEQQDILVEVVWTKPGEFRPITSQMLVENGVVYFLTNENAGNVRTGVSKCYLVALEAETGRVVWERKLTHTLGVNHPLAINGDYLHVVDWSPNCYNKHTGETIYETPWVDPYTEKEKISLDASTSGGITVYDGKLYYCTGMFYADPYPRELTKNVVCVDAMSGEYVWGYMIPRQGTLGTVLLVSRGKAYITTFEGLRVYNAYTGKVLWVDTFVNGSTESIDYADENMFVFFNANTDPYHSTLTAVTMD